jgi:CheY-like chemotaxis protein
LQSDSIVVGIVLSWRNGGAPAVVVSRRQNNGDEIMTTVRKVLVVADEPSLGQSLDRALTEAGCSVVTMANGAEALKTIATADYDLIFADAAAPGLGGIEIAAQVKAQLPWTPVVVIVGEGDAAAGRRAQAVGTDLVLHKPVSAQALADGTRQVLTSNWALAGYAETAPSPKRKGGLGGLMLSAIVSLGSAIAFPAVALTGVAWILAQRAAVDSGPSPTGETVAARIVLFFASPFVALFYMGIMPVIGMMELIKLGAAAEAREGRKPRTGIAGMISHILTGGRIWIADGR